MGAGLLAFSATHVACGSGYRAQRELTHVPARGQPFHVVYVTCAYRGSVAREELTKSVLQSTLKYRRRGLSSLTPLVLGPTWNLSSKCANGWYPLSGGMGWYVRAFSGR
jgi:hypothetical protein